MNLPCLAILVALCVLGGSSPCVAGTPPATATASPSPAVVKKPVEETTRRVNLPVGRDGATRTLWIAQTKAKLPVAILVLLPNKEQDVEAMLGAPVWQDYAQDRHLGLAALTQVSPAPRPAAPKTNRPTLSPRVGVDPAPVDFMQAIEREYHTGSLPLALYSWQQQAGFAADLVSKFPKRIKSWCLRSPDHLPTLLDATMPAGIVALSKENKALYDVLLGEFTTARKKGARLTWVALSGDKTPDTLPALDSFVRDYFPAASVYKPGLEQWTDINSGKPIGNVDANAQPAAASFLPQPILSTAWMSLHSPGGPSIAQQEILEHEEDTRNPKQPKLSLYLRRPVSGTGEVKGVLAYCTWERDGKAITTRLQNKDWFLVRYADAHRLALLTWSTADAFANAESADERSQQQNFKDDLGFDKLADAWERGAHALCYQAGLPENDFLLYGLSRGAQWAHRLALRKPEHFLAVNIHVNSSYDWPTPAARSILWLQTTGEREYGYPAALRFYARCREMGYPILFKAGENLGHASSPQIEELVGRFFDYAVEVKARRDDWIAHADHSFGHKLVLPTMYELSGLDEAPFCADLINQEVFGADERDLVPASQRVPLPTKTLAKAWGEMAAGITGLSLVSNPPAKTAAASMLRPSSADKAEAVKPDPKVEQPPPTTGSDAATVAGVASPGDPEDFSSKNRLSVQRALGRSPELAQAESELNAAFVGAYRRLQSSGDPLLQDPTWPERLLQIVHAQSAAAATSSSPEFQREFQASVQRALELHPTLAQADSPINSAFLAEYRRLKEAGDTLLSKPGWPEEVAHTVAEKAGSKL